MPKNKKISDLSNSEVQKACDNLAKIVSTNSGQLMERSCTVTSLLLSKSSSECENLKQKCLKAPTKSTCKEDFRTCTATVGEYEECESARVNYFLNAAKNLTCKSDPKDVMALRDNKNEPETCKVLDKKCPKKD